jgi:hypothetical protein
MSGWVLNPTRLMTRPVMFYWVETLAAPFSTAANSAPPPPFSAVPYAAAKRGRRSDDHGDPCGSPCTGEAAAKRPLPTTTTRTATQRSPFTGEAAAERSAGTATLLQKQRPRGRCLGCWNGDPRVAAFSVGAPERQTRGGLRLVSRQGQNSNFSFTVNITAQ